MLDLDQTERRHLVLVRSKKLLRKRPGDSEAQRKVLNGRAGPQIAICESQFISVGIPAAAAVDAIRAIFTGVLPN